MLKLVHANDGKKESTTVLHDRDLSELFYHINRVLPVDQKLLTILPDMKVRDALVLLQQHGYSQAPVVFNKHCLGVFSLNSFARKAAAATLEGISKDKCAPGDWPVEDCLDLPNFFRVTDSIDKAFSDLEKENFVLIGAPKLLQGVMTQTDVLHYFYKVASPFVMVSEIELTLRGLIRRAINQEQLEICANRCLKGLYGVGKVPQLLQEMTFDNYVTIISNGDNWLHFEPIFGGTRTRIAAKLRQLSNLRNDLFHFKRDVTFEDHQTLTELRNWILMQAQKADARRVNEEKI